jgi:RNA polymerase-interacting CarD/CdnL/TRCF family regulator
MANIDRLRSGERDEIAEVVRGLGARERDHGLSAGEQRMLWRARQLLQGPTDR